MKVRVKQFSADKSMKEFMKIHEDVLKDIKNMKRVESVEIPFDDYTMTIELDPRKKMITYGDKFIKIPKWDEFNLLINLSKIASESKDKKLSFTDKVNYLIDQLSELV